MQISFSFFPLIIQLVYFLVGLRTYQHPFVEVTVYQKKLLCIVGSPKSDFGFSSSSALNHCLVLLYRLITAGANIMKQMPLQSHLIVVTVRIGMERSCSDTNGRQYSLVEILNVMEGLKIRNALRIKPIKQNCNRK